MGTLLAPAEGCTDQVPTFYINPVLRFKRARQSVTTAAGWMMSEYTADMLDRDDVRFPGRWIVRVSERNHAGCRFWARVIAEYSSNTLTQATRPGTPHTWRVFSFNSVNGDGAPLGET
jgi:hypothetical protein